MNKTAGIISVILITALAISGCGIGPSTLTRDRSNYTHAISESWKSQMLLNMVKVRYGDTPIFLDVVSVINQYQVDQEFSIGADSEFYNRGEPSFIGPLFRAGGRYSDRPTVTYSPLTGEKFAKNLMTPLSPHTIFHLIQSGYPIDLVFRFAVQSVNGIQNRFGGMARSHPADPEFYPLIEHLKKIQQTNGVGLRIRKIKNATGKETVMMIFRERAGQTALEEGRIVRRMLGLDPEATEFKVVYDSVPRSSSEVAILTRSMLEVIVELASLIEVPESHVADKRVNPTMKENLPYGATVPPLIKIYSSRNMPSEGFISVQYRGHWFYIDDRDLSSKGMFSFLMFAFSLTETGMGKEAVPIVTIPTN